MNYIVYVLLGIITFLALQLHETWGEIDDLYEEIDELKEEAEALEATASSEKQKVKHYEMIFHECEFANFRDKAKKVAS